VIVGTVGLGRGMAADALGDHGVDANALEVATGGG
jgi:hypothetical protein